MKKLSSPEQLDQLIRVTSPKAWLALIALGLLLAAVIVWGIWGSIPATVAGQGILLNDGGVYSLMHHASGQVVDVRFKAGDTVKKGDVIARIDQPDLVEKIGALLPEIQNLESEDGSFSPKYQSLKNQVRQLRAELDSRSQIVSPIDGRILTLNMQKGSVIEAGQVLAVMDRVDVTTRLEAVLYVPAELAKDIRTGMEAQIYPSSVNKEEYGFMAGRVTFVGEYPETAASMLRTLGNENLVLMLTGQGAPVQVQIDLIPDHSTASRYRWSSPAGPPYAIFSGTLASGEVVVSRTRPIAKVIPLADESEGA